MFIKIWNADHSPSSLQKKRKASDGKTKFFFVWNRLKKDCQWGLGNQNWWQKAQEQIFQAADNIPPPSSFGLG